MSATLCASIAKAIHISCTPSQLHLQESVQQLQPLPISAVAVGKAPSRGDSTPTGSDILLDALQEEAVAAQAQQFLGSEQGQAALRDAK